MQNRDQIINYLLMQRLEALQRKISKKPLQGKTVVVTGGSRGIGLAIALKCAADGAKIAILAKTTNPHPKLPGTIFTAAQEIVKAGGHALPLACDIRDEANVQACIEKVVAAFGGIDILINNASAISLTSTQDTPMKKYDLMNNVNARGTFMVSKFCIPHLLKSKNGHILNISPPLNMEKRWFAPHVGYTMAKYGMSMCVLGMAEQFKGQICVNALWPKTAIATAAVKNLLGGDNSVRLSRTEQIMADSAYLVLNSKLNGQFVIDEEILRKNGVKDFSKYRVDKSVREEELMLDFFL